MSVISAIFVRSPAAPVTPSPGSVCVVIFVSHQKLPLLLGTKNFALLVSTRRAAAASAAVQISSNKERERVEEVRLTSGAV